MKQLPRYFYGLMAILVGGLGFVGCSGDDDELRAANDTLKIETADDTVATDLAEQYTTVTLPVVDVYLNDSTFLEEARRDLELTDAEIDSLRSLSGGAVREMYQRRRGESAQSAPYSTREGGEQSRAKIRGLLGEERGDRFMAMVESRWSSGGEDGLASAAADSTAGTTNGSNASAPTPRSSENPAGIPSDTRIVINIPSFRMDLFDRGRLVGSWKIAVGYPEFPLPTGVRRANRVIFNPTWTPPSESWVTESSDVEALKTIPAGSPKNPLGIAKIPIGLPNLIHSGKPQSWIGSFGSHGCVGLTDEQMKDFVKRLGEVSGTTLNDSVIAHAKKNRNSTQTIALANHVPVELRYETIVVVDGELVIYRDIYDYNTNTEERLRKVLRAYGVDMASIDQATRTKLINGLDQMAMDAQGESNSEDTKGGDTAKSKQEKVEVTRSLSGRAEFVINLPGIRYEGYPGMVDGDSARSGTASAGAKGSGAKGSGANAKDTGRSG